MTRIPDPSRLASLAPQDEADDIAKAMAGLRQTIEQRIADREQMEREKIRPNDLAQYDTAGLGRLLRPMLEADGRGWRVVAGEIGVTTPDLSRIVAGQTVSAAKIIAVCDWAKVDVRRFYKPPKKKRPALSPSKGFTGKALKQGEGFTGKALKQPGGAQGQQSTWVKDGRLVDRHGKPVR